LREIVPAVINPTDERVVVQNADPDGTCFLAIFTEWPHVVTMELMVKKWFKDNIDSLLLHSKNL